jgi:hypothetical protein
VLFAPSFDLATSDGNVARSGRGVPFDVIRQIMERLENPFLQEQVSMLGLLLQGEENAKEGLVVWPASTLDVDRLTVYMSGFSGETATIEVPDPRTPRAHAGCAPEISRRELRRRRDPQSQRLDPLPDR